jgi:hypothetical protein
MSWVELSLSYGRRSVYLHLGIGLLFGGHDQILSLSFVEWQLLCCSSCRAPSLMRGRVCNLQCNHWGPITIHYPLIWDCVPSSSPLTARRDYGGGILTRLHTGKCVRTIRNTIYKDPVCTSQEAQYISILYSNPPPHGVSPYEFIRFAYECRLHNACSY